jgi:hypothetical protein
MVEEVDPSPPAGVIHLAERRLRKQLKNKSDDPAIGEPRRAGGVEIAPGTWVGDSWGLPPDCPVEPLGMDGDILCCRDAMGQLAVVQPSAFGQKFIQRLFGERQNYLYWAWPRYDAKGRVASWRAEKVSEALYRAAALRGSFALIDRLRGRGAWRDKGGALIYHSGSSLWRTKAGRLEEVETGFIEGHFYPRRPDIPAPWPAPVKDADNPARTLIEGLRLWNWERPLVDPVLFLGLMAACQLGGALPWRPTGFVVGDKAVGKSTLQSLAKAVLGDALVQSADTTAAGIYQRIGQDSLAVAVDELEAETDARKTMAVIKLARLAASGAMMYRGGQDHVGVEFRAQSCFLFSSINPPPLLPQDLSRMAVLRLGKLAKSGSDAPPTVNADITGAMLLRKLMDNWTRFDRAFKAYRKALRAGGHDGRGQDTFGVLLACADLALGPQLADDLGIPMVDDLSPWSTWLATGSMLEYEDNSENWRNCVKHLLTSRVEAWRGGRRHTVGQLLEDLAADWALPSTEPAPQGALTWSEAGSLLAQAGLAVYRPGTLDGETARGGWILAVPNESQLVMELFKGTAWAGVPGGSVWKSALRQGPAEIMISDRTRNRVRINGVQERCTLIRLKAFNDWDG